MQILVTVFSELVHRAAYAIVFAWFMAVAVVFFAMAVAFNMARKQKE